MIKLFVINICLTSNGQARYHCISIFQDESYCWLYTYGSSILDTYWFYTCYCDTPFRHPKIILYRRHVSQYDLSYEYEEHKSWVKTQFLCMPAADHSSSKHVICSCSVDSFMITTKSGALFINDFSITIVNCILVSSKFSCSINS